MRFGILGNQTMAVEFKKILIINFRNLGDVLLMTPLISVLKQRFPESEIDVAIYADCSDMLSIGSKIKTKYMVDRISSKWKKLTKDFEIAKKIRKSGYDFVLSLTEGDRAAWYAMVSNAQTRVGFDHPEIRKSLWKRNIYTSLCMTQPDRKHRVEQNLDLLRSLGIQIGFNSIPLSFEVDDHARQSVAEKLKINESYVVVHPGARWGFKSLHVNQVSQLVKAIKCKGLDVIVTRDSSAREIKFVEDLHHMVPGLFQDSRGDLSIQELAALLDGAQMLFSSDSMPMHLAAAVGTKVIAWFGPSNQTVWHPWLVEHRILAMDYPCRPCGLDGCGRGKISECLVAIDGKKIEQAISELMT